MELSGFTISMGGDLISVSARNSDSEGGVMASSDHWQHIASRKNSFVGCFTCRGRRWALLRYTFGYLLLNDSILLRKNVRKAGRSFIRLGLLQFFICASSVVVITAVRGRLRYMMVSCWKHRLEDGGIKGETSGMSGDVSGIA
jgi:hypothetical protein